MYPRGRLVHEDAEPHLKRTLSEPLLSAERWPERQYESCRPRRDGRCRCSRESPPARPRIAVKNVTIYPKGLWLARRIRELEAEHVHAHWASVSATLALTGAELAGVPWSFTAHRWDIRESNLLRTKARSACFVRTISESGARDLRERIGLDGWSPTVIRMGVDLPARHGARSGGEGPLRLLTAANLLPVKGHRYLFEALAGQEGITLDVAGKGPLRAELEKRARGLRSRSSARSHMPSSSSASARADGTRSSFRARRPMKATRKASRSRSSRRWRPGSRWCRRPPARSPSSSPKARAPGSPAGLAGARHALERLKNRRSGENLPPPAGRASRPSSTSNASPPSSQLGSQPVSRARPAGSVG